MTDLLEKAVAAAKTLSPQAQDDIARMVLLMAGESQQIVELTSAEKTSLALSLDQATRGIFATDEQVRAVWSKHGL